MARRTTQNRTHVWIIRSEQEQENKSREQENKRTRITFNSCEWHLRLHLSITRPFIHSIPFLSSHMKSKEKKRRNLQVYFIPSKKLFLGIHVLWHDSSSLVFTPRVTLLEVWTWILPLLLYCQERTRTRIKLDKEKNKPGLDLLYIHFHSFFL